MKKPFMQRFMYFITFHAAIWMEVFLNVGHKMKSRITRNYVQ